MVTDAGDVGTTLQLSMYLYEGVFTRRDVYGDDGKLEKRGTYSSVLAKGDIVQICTTSGFDWTVMADYEDTADQSTDKRNIGIVKTTPSGKTPVVSSNGGTSTASTNADLRQATVEWPSYNCVREFIVMETASAATPVGWDYTGSAMSTAATNCPYILLETSTAAGTHSVMM